MGSDLTPEECERILSALNKLEVPITRIEQSIDNIEQNLDWITARLDEIYQKIEIKNPYEVLGVTATSNEEEIRRAYKKIAFETHPDRIPGREREFITATKAYEMIINKNNF